MPERPPFKPFPEIARFPSSNEVALDGAPQSDTDSIFLSVPELSRVAQLINELKQANSAERHRLLEHQAEILITQPKQITAFFDAVEMHLANGIHLVQTNQIKEALAAVLERTTLRLEQSTPEVWHEWLELYTESAVYRPLAEKVMQRALKHCNTTNAITESLYNLALGGLKSSNSKIRLATLEILTYQSTVLPADSAAGLNHLLACFDLDDSTLQRFMEIDGAVHFLAGSYKTDLIERKKQSQKTILASDRFKQRSAELDKKNPERAQALDAFYNQAENELGIIELGTQPIDLNAFPWQLVLQGGPLRRWLNDYMAKDITARREGTEQVSLHLPSWDVVLDRPVQTAVQEKLQQETPQVQELLLETMYWETLSHLTPQEFSPEQCQDLLALNQLLREDMHLRTRYLLSPRGDNVEIKDPTLNTLGFSDLTFTMNPTNKRETIVTVKVGKYRFRLLLDEFFTPKNHENRTNMMLPRDGEFLQSIILSHLHAIRCSENVVESGIKTESGKPGARDAFMTRRAHLRRLQPGHKPASEQVKKALADYDIDIIRLNREAEARQQPTVTFVSEIEQAGNVSLGPVRSYVKNATQQIYEALQRQ